MGDIKGLQMSKLPPNATDLEEVVLGTILSEKGVIDTVLEILPLPEMFYSEKHVLLYKTMIEMYKSLIPLDMMTLTNQLRKKRVLEKLGGAYFITQLIDRVISSANIEHHCRIIVEKHILRDLIKSSSNTIEDCYMGQKDVFDILSENSVKRDDLQSIIITKKELSNAQLYQQTFKSIIASRDVDFTGVPSGFTELDRLTGGWQPGHLAILAARPAMGKTSLALSFAFNAAIDFNKAVAVFSLEMTAEQLMRKQMSIVGEIPLFKLNKPSCLNENDIKQLEIVGQIIENAPIFWDDTPAIKILEFRAKCRRLKAKYNIEMIIVDYLQLMTGEKDGKGNREQEIGSISRMLKSVAKELDVPVLALSQLSRAVESRPNKRPMLSDLRESGSIEQDADAVMFLYRPEYYGINENVNGESTAGLAELILAKNRHGETDDIAIEFIGKYTKFKDWQDSITSQQNFVDTNSFSNFTNNDSLQRDFSESENFDVDDAPF
ncbi:replicative DNA helicase [Sphingobacterium sp. ML3W]|uniref:replicative DNA helicase n=1 Tax=Sphingobacterium sp. ML3W TaxID=1538644 RepID=UPI00068C99E2|nr:replicative DNA helicase [Sphingobacterium sp. ML3W]